MTFAVKLIVVLWTVVCLGGCGLEVYFVADTARTVGARYVDSDTSANNLIFWTLAWFAIVVPAALIGLLFKPAERKSSGEQAARG